jgi:type I restriction enzyme, S subunit
MSNYSCEKCNKDFSHKGDYLRHIKKKYPCVTQEELKNLNDDKLIELKDKISEVDSLKYLESFFSKIRDLLRNEESITGDKSLDVITDFLFLKLLNDEIETNTKMNFISKKYNQKLKIGNIDYDIDEYKKYFKWSELMNLVNIVDKDSGDNKSKQLIFDVISSIIFGGIFKFNENTKDIYKNRRFFVKKILTVIRLLKEFHKIDFTKYDCDITGKAYELTLQKEASTNKDFGQFFTPRLIDNYLISNAEIKIKKDGTYTKIMDPACGTAGILLSYLSEIKKHAEKKNITIDNDISKYIHGFEIVDDTLKLAHMNMLLKSRTYNISLKNIDFLEVGCLDYVNEKFDGHIIMNPPFALTKKYYLEDNELEKIFNIKTKSGTMLFLLAALHTIKNGNQIIMVSPNGKEIFSKNKEFMNIRKYIMENANIYKIAINPDGSFKPYTGVQTLNLIMKKGEKTKEIEFVKLENINNVLIEKKICKVKYEELEKKNFSWNYKEYYSESTIKYGDIEYKKLIDICDLQNGKFITKDMDNNGIYDFYSGESKQPIGKHSNFCFDGEKYIILIRAGGSQGKYGDNIGLGKVFLINGKTAGTSPTLKIELKNTNTININYLYIFLKIKKNYISDLAHYTTSLGRISQESIENLQIPVPPIEIQNKIVEELDGLFALKENFKKSVDIMENTYKKSIFEMLLYGCENIKEYKLKNVCKIKTGKNKPDDKLEDNKPYPYYGTGGITGYTNNYLVDGEYLLTPRNGTIGNFIKCNGKSFPSDHMFIIKLNSEIITINFLNYCVMKNNLSYYKTGATIPNITKNILEDVKLKIPSLKDQKRIIKEMEKYDLEIEFKQNEIKKIDEYAKIIFNNYLNKCKEEKTNESIDENNESENLTNLSKKSNKENSSNLSNLSKKSNKENSSNLSNLSKQSNKENSSNLSKKSKTKNEIDNNELLEEINNINEKIIKKTKKSKNKIIENSNPKNEESKNEKNEKLKDNKIIINDKEYIKEGKKVYKIKSGEKGKLYGTLDKKGNFEKIATNEK